MCNYRFLINVLDYVTREKINESYIQGPTPHSSEAFEPFRNAPVVYCIETLLCTRSHRSKRLQ